MPLEQLKQVTGYVRGGCSPIGMKHLFPTTIDVSAKNLDKLYVSGGQRGMQIIIQVDDLIEITQAQWHILHINKRDMCNIMIGFERIDY